MQEAPTVDPFTWTEVGWCSNCGIYAQQGPHVCPDGTVPVSVDALLTPVQPNEELFGSKFVK